MARATHIGLGSLACGRLETGGSRDFHAEFAGTLDDGMRQRVFGA